MRFAFVLVLGLFSLSATAQVDDDFSDGDFTSNPAWGGDTDRFTIIPFGDDFAVQSDGLAEPDTIYLSTASSGSRGEWRFLFQWNFNLSTSNGVRIYLSANNADLRGSLQGYFLQLGTNNDDEVRLYRQDGASSDRTLLASGTEGLLAGDSGTVELRVLRDEDGLWQIDVNGSPDISGVVDNTFDVSTHLGFWVKHSTTASQAYVFDDVFQDPTAADLTPPELLGAEAIDELTVEVEFDEEVVPEPGDYMIDNGIGTPVTAELVPGIPEKVSLTLATPLPINTTFTLTVTNVADPAGNVLVNAETTFFFGSLYDPEPGDVVINEIMYDPPSPQPSDNEWVELYNRSDGTFDLAAFSLQDEGGTPIPITATSMPVEPGEYVVLVNDGAEFSAAFPGVEFIEVAGFPSLNNSGDRPAILFETAEIDAVSYTPSWGGEDASLERIDPAGPSNFPSNWATTTDPLFGTPGAENSVFKPDVTPPDIDRVLASDPDIVDVFFNEPVDPTTAGNASNYSIDNGVGTPAVASVAPEGDPTHVQLILSNPLVPNTEHTLTATGISDLVGNVSGTLQATFFFGQGETPEANDVVINEFLYDEPDVNNPAEYIELFNRSNKVFDLADFTIGDSSGETDISTESVFLQPGGYAVLVEDGAAFETIFPEVDFVDVSGWRSLNNSGDAVVLRSSGSVIDSLFYDDSWGGENASLERKDPEGPSGFAVNWATTTDPQGGTPGDLNSVYMPDIEGPSPVSVAVSLDGLMLSVVFDEPLDPESVAAGAFTISGPVSPIVSKATYSLSPDPTVMLTLASALQLGDYLLAVSGVTDLLGNESQGETIPFSFEPDETAPALEAAFAVTATTVEVRFTE
ncbi:MAG: lamin tail domain-containing protein, partial [Rubricoccaceae bacterium]|nr:lamin tail domain-containing protein [Rubricoccaceae bacterium]